MISAILGFVTGVLGFLNGMLPNSPFADVIAGNEGILQGIGWLNWIFPVGDCMLIFAAYLAVLLLWAAVDMALGYAGKSVFGVVGGK